MPNSPREFVMKQFSELIVRIRSENKLSQLGMGKKLGCDSSSISKWEQCRCFVSLPLLDELIKRFPSYQELKDPRYRDFVLIKNPARVGPSNPNTGVHEGERNKPILVVKNGNLPSSPSAGGKVATTAEKRRGALTLNKRNRSKTPAGNGQASFPFVPPSQNEPPTAPSEPTPPPVQPPPSFPGPKRVKAEVDFDAHLRSIGMALWAIKNQLSIIAHKQEASGVQESSLTAPRWSVRLYEAVESYCAGENLYTEEQLISIVETLASKGLIVAPRGEDGALLPLSDKQIDTVSYLIVAMSALNKLK